LVAFSHRLAMVRSRGLKRVSVVWLDQIHSVDKERLAVDWLRHLEKAGGSGISLVT